MKHLMNKGDGNRTFPDGGRHPLEVAAPHVADREDSGTIRFQQIRRPRQWPSACRQVLWRQVRTGLDEPAPVECDAPIEPARIRHGARHHEHMSDVMRLSDAGAAVEPPDAIEMPVAVQRYELRSRPAEGSTYTHANSGRFSNFSQRDMRV